MATLLTLPKELRSQIYLHVFQAPQQPYKIYPPEPPLLLVSQTIRHDALPVFYSTNPLTIHATIDRNSYNKIHIRYHPWYHDLPPSRLQYIKILKLRFDFLERYFGEVVMIYFDIVLKKHSGFEIRHSFAEGWWKDPRRKGDPADCEEVIAILRRHFETTLDALEVGSEGIELSADGLDRLLEIDPDTLP